MKTGDLIRMLQQIDPDGEMQVLIQNSDIHPVVTWEPGYHDGVARVTVFEGVHPVRTELRPDVNKIQLCPVDLGTVFRESIYDDGEPYFIDTSKASTGTKRRFEDLTATWTEEAVNVCCGFAERGLMCNEKSDDRRKMLHNAEKANALLLRMGREPVQVERIERLLREYD